MKREKGKVKMEKQKAESRKQKAESRKRVPHRSRTERADSGRPRVSHLRRYGFSCAFLTQRLRTGLTCDAPMALGKKLRGPSGTRCSFVSVPRIGFGKRRRTILG